jgi:hypothetical protein
MKQTLFYIILSTFLPFTTAYSQVRHRTPSQNEIPVTIPGSYSQPGATYILVNDISSPRSAIFLGKDVTIDLNGYTITYADGNYSHVPNYGFEDGLAGWDISKAPGAKIENTAETHAFIGEKLCRLRKGDELISGYVFLPEQDRSYYAMCGITGFYYNEMKGDLGNDMRISIFVDDSQGNEVKCITSYRDTTMVSCPVTGRSARLGGGFVIAHLTGMPSGKYRIRVRAETDCLIDEVDIRPALDAGIGIAGEIHAYGHNDHLYSNLHAAFFDYSAEPGSTKPRNDIPVVTGAGTVTIKNGIIRNGTKGILSWGVQSTAGVKVILDSVRFITSGINTTAVDVEQATITRCSFETDNPFIINRHGSEFYAVDLRGDQPSEVSFSEFHGGQGCLSFKGKNSSVHHNLFVNRQTVTNHYSIMAMGDGSKIFDNIFKPEIGSGIEIFRKKFIEIFNNEFHIKAAPPSCEYADHLSTNAVRIADYGAAPGAPNGAYGNKVYNNRFFITGKKYKQYPDFIPMASAFFYSASAGENEIFGNEIILHQEDPGTDAEAFAFYVGNARGGRIFSNRIVTNVTPVWVATGYGKAENTIIESNEFIKAGSGDFSPVRMGSGYAATGIEFRSNSYEGMDPDIEATDRPHSYKVFWTLEVSLVDRKGNPVTGTEVIITGKDGKEAARLTSNSEGRIKAELPEHFIDGKDRVDFSPYTIKAGKSVVKVDLKKNIKLTTPAGDKAL